MKININLLFTCVVLIAFLRNAQGGLVSGLVERIHKTVHKVSEDVHTMLLPKEKYNQDVTSENKPKEIKGDTADAVNASNKNSGGKIIMEKTDTTENIKNNNPVIPSPIKPHDDHEMELKEGTTEESFIFATSSSTVAPASSTTVKEGRENFAAGCSTGYKRTADGRCKATFR